MDDLPPSTEVTINAEESDKRLKLIRRDWKWAAASDFLYKFNPMLHLDFLDLADVEHDIIHGTSDTIMNVLLKILHVLTSIRGLSRDTWEMYLRRLYARRVPENRVWGTEEEPIDWKDFTWQDRLEVLYTLTDWLFQAPLKVRQAMRDDSDDAAWRSAPIGKDAMRNEYWHLGRDRLWIRRAVDKPVTEERDLKRKRGTKKGPQKPSKRKAVENGKAKATSAKSKAKPKEAKKETKKELKKEPKKETKKVQPKHASKPSQSSGSRASGRMTRGTDAEGWQKVPDELLQEPPASSSPRTQTTDVEALFDDDLTDLSEDSKDDASKREDSSDDDSDLTDLDEEAEKMEIKRDVDVKMETDPKNDGEFVEFETICVTISEWKELAERFKSVRSHNERRLYRYITQVIVPEMEQWQEALDEKQKKDLRDMLKREQAAAAAAAAEARPKRSSRLAVLAEEDKKHSSQGSVDGDSSDWGRGGRYGRTRRAAARGARWFAEHQDSLADTPDSQEGEDVGEEKEQGDGEMAPRPRRKRQGSDQEDYQDESEIRPPEPAVNGLGRPRRAAAVKADLNRPRPVTRRRRARSDSDEENESDEPFFLNCEVCKRSGWNQDDSQHLISCQDCGIWQHMLCHDRVDKIEGRPKRNWGEERFLCTACLAKAQNKRPRRGRKPKETIPGEGAEHEDIDGAAVEASQATLPPSSQDTAEGSPVQDAPMDISTSPQASRPTISFASGANVNGFQNASSLGPNSIPPSHDNQTNLAPPQPVPQFHQVSMWTLDPVNQMSQPPVNPYASFAPALNGFASGSFGNVAQQQMMPFNGQVAPAVPLANGLYQPPPQQPISQSMPLASNVWSQGQVPHVNGNSQPAPSTSQQQPIQHPLTYQLNQPSS